MMLKALPKVKFCVVIKVSIFFQDKGTLVVIHLVFLLFLAFIAHVSLFYFCPWSSSDFLSLK